MNRQEISMRLSQKAMWVLSTYLKGAVDEFNETFHSGGDFAMPYPLSINQAPSAPVGAEGLYPRVSVFPSSSNVTYDAANTTHGLATTFQIVVIFDRVGYNEEFNLSHAQSMCEMVGSLLEEHLPEAQENSPCYVVDGNAVSTQAARFNENVDVIISTSTITAYSRPELLHKPTISPSLRYEPVNDSIATQTTATLSVTHDGGTDTLTLTNGVQMHLEAFENITGLAVAGQHTSVDAIMVVNQSKLESLTASYAAGTDSYDFSSIPRSEGDTITVSWLANNGRIFSFVLVP